MQFNLDYFYGNEPSQFRFYRVPKALFDSDLSLEAATLYSLMLDRVGLSVRNVWVDSLGRVFIYFVQKDVKKSLRCGHNRATTFMRKLERFGLIERKHQAWASPPRFTSRISPAVRTVPRKMRSTRLIRFLLCSRRMPLIRLFFCATGGSQDCPRRTVQSVRRRQSGLPESGG